MRVLALLVALGIAATGCGNGSDGPSSARTVTVYTSVTQETVDAVVAAFEKAEPGTRVDVFRAPTGELSARIASEQRSGVVRADVIWATDPLSMHAWDSQHILADDFDPGPAADRIPAEYRSEDFWGTRVLYLVIVEQQGLRPRPTAWADLADPVYRDRVEIPDPAFAGSAFAALGYFSTAPGYGIDFFRRLRDNGATQVPSPTDVVTDVAEGRADLGMTLSFSAATVEVEGSPIRQVWPEPGAIAVYSPIGLVASSPDRGAGASFIRFVLSEEGQQVIAASGWQPAVPGIEGPPRPADADIIAPDWPSLFERQEDLLASYREIFPS